MKLVSFEINTALGQARRIGVPIDGDETGRIADLTGCYAAYLASETDEPTPRQIAAVRCPPDMIGWLKGAHKSRAAAEEAAGWISEKLITAKDPTGIRGERLVFPRDEVKLLAPVPRPGALRDFSIFQTHMSNADVPFKKTKHWYVTPPYYKGNCDTITGPEEPVPFPYYTERLDLELELGIIVGKKGTNLTIDEAKDHIAGYTILIDPSCRDGYKREPFGPNKRKDFCTPMGPCLVTSDSIDERNIACRIEVDGETWWEGNTGEPRSFWAEHLVAYVSDNETVFPGDIIGTGTIGLGCSMDIHKWPQVGQNMTFTMQGIGSMTLAIVKGDERVRHVDGMSGLLEYPGEDI
ncbi:MAG: Ureidoglycolate lyase [Alphaproteobacteria bacterium MarineAlpha11_Bin1]|nr:MAG: Ureidoglycolate lyase [Alphaproteobacteria bacterium MarineAlpha11_Bin1]